MRLFRAGKLPWLFLLIFGLALGACSDDDDDEVTTNDDDDIANDDDSQACETADLECGLWYEADEASCSCVLTEVGFSVTPDQGGSFGETLVTVEADQPIFEGYEANEVRILLGEVDIIFKEKISDSAIQGITQGHPAPSRDNDQPFDVGLTVLLQLNKDSEDMRELPTWESLWETDDLFTYDPPLHPVFNEFWAIGASFCAGFQADSLNAPAQLMGPAAQVARQVGAYFPLPLAREPGIPPAPTLADVNQESGSTDVDITEALALLAPSLFTGHFLDIRENPYTFTHNTSVPGGVVSEILNGATGELGLLENFIQQPFVIGSPDTKAPILLLEEHQPTIIMSSVDVFGNDVLGGDDNSTLQIEADLDELFGRILAIESEPMVFILSLPDVNALPDERFEQDERYEVIRANNALARAAQRANDAAGETRIVFGDFFGMFVDLLESHEGDRLEFGGSEYDVALGANGEGNFLIEDANGVSQQMSLDRFGGLISFDDLHLTNTGYAWLANAIIESLNETIGPDGETPLLDAEIEYIDLGRVLADDPYSPVNLADEAAELGFRPLETYADEDAVPLLAFYDRCAIEFNPELSLGLEDGCPASITIVEPAVLATTPNADLPITFEVLDIDGLPLEGIPVVGNPWDKDEFEDRLQSERGVFTGPDGRGTLTLQPRGEEKDSHIFLQAGGVIESYTVTKILE